MMPLWIALAGGLGALVRFEVDSAIARHNRSGFPLGTLVINITGSFALGLLTGWLLAGPLGALGAIVGIGFLGGYTTFSTASVEGARLLRAGRGWSALAHAGGMLLVSLLAAGLGLWLTGPN